MRNPNRRSPLNNSIEYGTILKGCVNIWDLYGIFIKFKLNFIYLGINFLPIKRIKWLFLPFIISNCKMGFYWLAFKSLSKSNGWIVLKYEQLIDKVYILLFSLFLLLFMSFTVLFSTIYKFLYTILSNFYFIYNVFNKKFSIPPK